MHTHRDRELGRAHEKNFEISKLTGKILVAYFRKNVFKNASNFWCIKFYFDN